MALGTENESYHSQRLLQFIIRSRVEIAHHFPAVSIPVILNLSTRSFNTCA